MTKPKLADFIENPNQAMRQGYYPDFMSCGAFTADTMSISSICYIYDLCRNLLLDDVISLPKNLLILIIYTFGVVTFPILFPCWWVVVWTLKKSDYKLMPKRIKEQEDRLNNLL